MQRRDIRRTTCVRVLHSFVATAALAAPSSVLLAQGASSALEAAARADTGHTTKRDTTRLRDSTARTISSVNVVGSRKPKSTSGTKAAIPLLETPQSITLITNQQMNVRGVQSLNDALRYTPAVTAQAAGTDTRFDRVFIRGFDQTIAMYRDGMRWGGDTEGGTEPYGLEQVEVLRGPSSTLYGQTGPGGLVNVTSKRPTRESLRELQYQTGSYGRQQIAGDFGGALDEAGRLSYRLTGLGRISGTPIERIDDDRVFIAPALKWAPSDQTTVTLLTSYQRDNTGFLMQWLPREGTAFPNPHGKIARDRFLSVPGFDRYDRNAYHLGYLLEHYVGSWSFRQNTRYSNSHVESGVAYGTGLQSDMRTLNRRVQLGDLRHAAWTVDNQASKVWAQGAVEQTLLFGVDYRRIVSREAFGYIDAPPIDIFEPVYTPIGAVTVANAPTITGNQIGLYAQDHIKLGQRWAVLAGGRMDWLKSLTDNPVTDIQTKEGEHALTGRLGLVYLSANGLAPYASYSRSFSPVFGTNVHGERYDPETGQQVELGVKYQPFGWNGFVTAALFDIRKQNVRTTDPTNPANQIQTGEQRSRGVELEATTALARGLNMVTSYSFTDIKVTKSNSTDLGKRPTLAPKHLGSAWLDYALLREFGLGAGVRYIGTTFGDPLNTFTVRANTLVDGMLRYSLQRWSVTLNARNVLDRQFAKCWSATGCNWGERRNVTANFGYRW